MNNENTSPWLTLLGCILIIAILIGINMGIDALVYGDPLCVIKHCVVVKGGEE